MQQAEFYREHVVVEEIPLDTVELVALVKSFSSLCDICFSLLGPRGEPLFIHCPVGAECLTSLLALPPTEELQVEYCPKGALRVIASVQLAGQTCCYLMGGVPAAPGDRSAEARLRDSIEQLRQVVKLLLRQTLQLEGLGRETLLRYEELNLLYEMGESIISDMTIDEIMAHMLERAVEITEAQGGAIVLLGAAGSEDDLTAQVALGWGSEYVTKGKTFRIGEGALGQAIAQRRPQMLAEALDDQLYGSKGQPLKLESVLCIPLSTTARLVGSMILVNKGSGGYFTAGDEKLSLAIASQAAIAIENNRLQQRIREEERIGADLQRYVSPNVVRAVLEGGGLQQLIGDRWKATILFVDIRDFSIVVEQTPPNVMITVLNEYFREMSEIIFRYQGAIDEFAGDQLLAIFGIPLVTPKGAENAVRAAVEIVRRMEQLCADWQRRGLPVFKVGLGLNTGWVAVGNIGSEKRMELTVIGPPVVIASRVEDLNKLFGTQILVTQDTLDEVRDIVLYRERGEVMLRGISRPISLYEITGLRDAQAQR